MSPCLMLTKRPPLGLTDVAEMKVCSLLPLCCQLAGRLRRVHLARRRCPVRQQARRAPQRMLHVP